MKKFRQGKRVIRATNAIKPAAPASNWGKGVPGKGGNTTNFAPPTQGENNKNSKEA